MFWGVSSILLLVLSFYVWSRCSVFLPSYDSSLIAIGSNLLLEGKQLYKDIHTVMLPGSYYFLALLFTIFGNSLMTCQITVTVEIVLSAFLLLLICRKISLGWFSLLPPAFISILGTMVCPHNSHHWDSLILVLLYALLLIDLPETRTKTSTLFCAGVVGGLSVLCYQNQIVPVLVGALSYSYLQKSGRALVKLLAGMLAVWTGFFIYALSGGFLNEMFNCTVLFVLSRYHGVNAAPYGYNNWQDFIVAAGSFPLSIFSGMTFGFIKIAPILVLAGAFIYFKKNSFSKDRQFSFLFVLAFSLWVAELHKPDFTRLIFGEPLLLSALFYLVQKLSEYSRAIYIATSIACISLFAGLAQDAKIIRNMYQSNLAQYQSRRGTVTSNKDMSILNKLNELTRPGEKVLVYPYDTGLIYLAGITTPSRYPVLHYGYHTEEQFREVISDMDKSKVKYVVWNRLMDDANHAYFGFSSYKRVSENEKIMEPYLRSNYNFVSAFNDYCLLVRK